MLFRSDYDDDDLAELSNFLQRICSLTVMNFLDRRGMSVTHVNM